MSYTIRPATPADVPELARLIERSARALSAGFYSAEETEAAIRYVYGVDSSLIADGTYFVVESPEGEVAGCGGWSRRRKLYGGDQHSGGESPAARPRHRARQDPRLLRRTRARASRCREDAARPLLGRRVR